MRYLCLIALVAGCGARGRPTSAELRSFYYTDNSGLNVSTTALDAERPLSRRITLRMRGVADHVALHRHPLDPGDPAAMSQPTGHHPDPDVVSSASATAGGGAVAEKWRVEGAAGVAVAVAPSGAPGEVEARARVSVEPDYRSISGGLAGSIELFRRNTTLSGFVGFGYDTIEPVEDPAGQAGDWPASHHRLTAGAAVKQLVSRRVVAGAGVAFTAQRGMLANPYRRALVRTTLFPEVMPDARERVTAFVDASIYLGRGAALHARQGLYVDSWEVIAWIPELALAVARDRLTALVRYRYYRQGTAWFYQARYDDVERFLTGDPRLGRISAHTAGAEARWSLTCDPEAIPALGLIASYDFSWLSYVSLGKNPVLAHTLSLGLGGAY